MSFGFAFATLDENQWNNVLVCCRSLDFASLILAWMSGLLDVIQFARSVVDVLDRMMVGSEGKMN